MVKYESGNFRFSLDLTKPIYEQVLDQIRHSVARGEIQLGIKIPSVRELAQDLKVNPNTIMRAYQELERDKLCETRRGQGTFITEDAQVVVKIKRELAVDAIQSFISSMNDLGIDKDQAIKLLKEEHWHGENNESE